MQAFLYIELNGFCLAILLLIFFNIRHRRDQMLTEQKLFLLLILAVALILVLDSAMWLLDGSSGSFLRVIYYGVTVLYYILNPVICMLWYLYVDFLIYGEEGHLKKALIPMSVPALITLLLAIGSGFNGALFSIDAGNVYHRGRLFLVMAACAFFYLVYTWALTVVKRKSIPRQDFLPITIFMIPVIIGGLIQALVYRISLVWACTTVSILIVFINLQNAKLYTDHLTGLFNRRQLDRYLPDKVRRVEAGLLAGLMIDIDAFKSINDKYGHSVGDQALIDTSEILKKTFRKNDFIARFGGDEFVVVMGIGDKTDLQKAIDRLHLNVALFNTQKTAPYTISLSVGYDCYLGNTDKSVKDFLDHLDTLMYRDKSVGTGDQS